MQWTPLNSRHLEEIAYDEDGSRLMIRFTDGSEYHYREVPQQIVDSLVGAPSAGRYFHEAIRGRYRHERVN